MDALGDGASKSSTLIQDKQSSVYLKAQKFREEQLCALQTLGDWQQDGYKSYSSFDFSSIDDTSSIHTNSVASILNSSISAAILAKKRVLKWQEERSQTLKGDENGTARKTLPEDHSTLFKVPLPKRVTVRIELHDWYFGIRSRNWVLIGRMIDNTGRTKKYTSKSLLQYFEREKARKICSVDQKKILVLSGSCALANSSPDQLHHPNYIQKTFRHGFPRDWKTALHFWSDFQLQGQPANFSWPTLDTSTISNSSTICSNFTSVTDRIAPLAAATGQSSANPKILRNIGVEVDSRYALNKFLSATEATPQHRLPCIAGLSGPDPGIQLLNGAELLFPNLNKSQNNVEILDSAALNQLPYVECSIPGSSKWPVENTLHVSRAPARHSAKDHHVESQNDDNRSEPRNVVGTSTLHHLDESGERLASNVVNRSRSSSSKQRDEKTVSQPKAKSRNNLKKDNLESQKNDGSSEPRHLLRTSSSHAHDSDEIVPSSVDISSKSSSCKRKFKQKLQAPQPASNYCSQKDFKKNDETEELRNLVQSSMSHAHATAEKEPSIVANRLRSRSYKRQFKQTLQAPRGTSSNSSKENHSKLRSQDVEGESRTPPSPTNQRLVTSEMALKPNILQSMNQMKPTSLKSSNQHAEFRTNLTDTTLTQPLEENNLKSNSQSRLLTADYKCYKNLCGKAINVRCSFEWCYCSLLSNRVMVLELTKVDSTGSSEQETAKKIRKFVKTSEAASNLPSPTKKSSQSASVLALANWRPVILDNNDELLLAGDIIDSIGNVEQKSHLSCPVHVRRNDIFHTSDGSRYSLVGTLSPLAKKNMPRNIARSYFKNDLFPRSWKKMISEWTSVGGLRSSTRQRTQPIQYWKVPDPSGFHSGSSTDDHRNKIQTNERKRVPTSKYGLRTHNGKATKHEEAKGHETEQRSRNHPDFSEPSSSRVEKRSRKSTRTTRKMALEEESNCSQTRLRQRSPSESSSDETNSRKLRSPIVEKKFRKRRNPIRFSTSEKSDDSDDSGNERLTSARISKQKQFGKRGKLRTAIGSSQNQESVTVKNVHSNKSAFTNRHNRIFSRSDSDEIKYPNISQPEMAARHHSSHALSESIGPENSFSESDYLPLLLARNKARWCVDEVETVPKDDSEVRRVESDEVASRPSTSLPSHRKVVSYPWMSDADTSMDSDSTVRDIPPSIRLQQSDSGNTEKNHQIVEKSTSYARSICTNLNKPVPEVQGSIQGLTKIREKVLSDNKPDTNNSQSIRRSGHCNPADDQCVIQSNTHDDQNVDDTSFDNMSLSIVFSETDPRAARF